MPSTPAATLVALDPCQRSLQILALAHLLHQLPIPPGFRCRAPPWTIRSLRASGLGASPLDSRRQGQFYLGFLPLVVHEKLVLLALPFKPSRAPFGPSVRDVSAQPICSLHLSAAECLTSFACLLPTSPSADFCTAFGMPRDTPQSHDSRTRCRSPEVSLTAFPTRPPDLPSRLLMVMDFAVIRPLVPAGEASYLVSVRQVVALLRASFRPRLATTPLRFANPSPPSGWVEDFHLQAVKHARHT